ncbi:MAG: VapC toxin family PIN domain ribonuclease [Akkermansiaceae bacterium]|nr:VapC toxin family PIN domain ribonuclease [Akkermansiaceae bacterium]MCF7731415.1 VapC toxin family PIN domain ribonuclease [Akkermansiaceae bacterium]
MTTYLLDGNVLVAMAICEHVHRTRCLRWFRTIEHFATCPVTEGTLLRIHMMMAANRSAAAAWHTLEAYRAHPKHQSWLEGFSYSDIDPTRLTGHRQVTDAWLAELARRKRGKLATLDESLSTLWPDATCLIPL